MPALTYEIGARNAGLRAAVSDSKSQIKDLVDFTRRQNSAGGAGGGGFGGNKLGLASQQFSDIAVQLQGNAKFATVFAQQGSQLASLFGPAGMILGGVVAIGGALVTWGLNAKESFEKTQESYQKFDAAVRSSIKFGGVSELDQTVGQLPEKFAEVRKQIEGTKGVFKGIGIGLGTLFGGASQNQQLLAGLKQERELLASEQEALERRVELEKEATEIVKLRADGRNDEADALERESKLREQIGALSKRYTGETLEQLKTFATTRSVLQAFIKEQEAQKKIEEECTQEAEKYAQVIEKQETAERRLGDALLEIQRKVMAMHDDRVEAERELAQVGESGADKQMRLLNEYAALQGALHAAEVLGMSEAERIREQIAKKQIELGENGLQLNKDNLSEEEKRTKNMAALAAAVGAVELSLENQKTENIKNAVEERLKTPTQRSQALAEKREEQRELRKEIAARLEHAQAKRQRDRKDPMTEEEKNAFKKKEREAFKGEQEQQKKQAGDISAIAKSVKSLEEKIAKA